MPAPNVFESDLFSLTTMTAAINKQPAMPNRVRRLGIFEEKGIPTTTAWIEFREGKLKLVANQERGAPGQNLDRQKRKALNGFRVAVRRTSEILVSRTKKPQTLANVKIP